MDVGIHRLITLSVLAALTVPVDAAVAQGAPPAPMPEQGATAVPASECMKDFVPLREDAEKKGKLVKQASDRHAPPQETCKLVRDYSEAEVKLMGFVDDNSSLCGIPSQVADQLRAGHRGTERLRRRVCATAEGTERRAMPGAINDIGDPAFKGPRF
jgi:hypothetical protein